MKGLFLEGIDKSGLLIAFIAFFAVLFTLSIVHAQEIKTIKLPEVSKSRGASLMDALSKKASAQSWSDKDLSMQDLSDLLWSAAGINRPDSKKRTYSSAMNTQDVDVYVFMKDGIYIYDYENHALKPVISGDHRADIAGSFSMSGGGMPSGGPSGGQGSAPAGAGQPGIAPGGAAPAGAPSAGAGGGTSSANFPVDLLLVSDPSKYRAGTDDLKNEWGAFSAGIITQNVMLFCSANELGTRPRAMFDKAKLKTLLKLKDTQNPVIELPVGYLK